MFWIFSDYNTSASVVFPNSNMSQYCTFSRIFLGKMLLAIIPLPWLFMSEAGQGWQRDRFTKSLRLVVALMSDGFQRTSSFCSPINTSSKWSESLNFQSFFPLLRAFVPPSLCCDSSWIEIPALSCECCKKPAGWAQAVLSLQSQARPAELQAPPSPAGLCLSPLEALAERELPAAVSCGSTGMGRRGCGSIPFRTKALAQQQPASCRVCSVLLPAPRRSRGLRSRFVCQLTARELSALGDWTLIPLMINSGMLPCG